MKICFMGDGNSIHIRRWMDYFTGRGHEVHLITFSKVDKDKLSNIFVHNIANFSIKEKGGNWKYLLYISEIKQLIKEIKPDIINSHYVSSYGFLGSLASFKPYVMAAWGTDILVSAKKNIVYRMLTKHALKNSQLVSAESQAITSEIKNIYNVDVITVPMGVENKICDLKRMDEVEEIKILSLRTVNENSNINTIVEAFYNICAKYPDKPLKLIIANDGVKMQEIRQLVKALKLEHKVEIRGFITREVLIDLLLSSDIHISITNSDSSSVTVFEAMVCGSMNIVSDIPANREWINEKLDNGLVIEEINPKCLAKAIDFCINNREKRAQWEKVNRGIIKEKAVWENNMAFVENKFQQLIEKYKK